jgi:hypothetical protein
MRKRRENNEKGIANIFPPIDFTFQTESDKKKHPPPPSEEDKK